MASRRSGNTPTEIEVNFTSFLDVIFNILAFFIFTYSPPLPEKNYDLSLPPPKKQEQEPTDQLPGIEEEIYPDLTITLAAGADGGLAGIMVDGTPVRGGIAGLVRQLRITAQAIGGAFGDAPLETANIIADPKLKYGDLMAVVDACYRSNIRRINFGAAAEAGDAPAP